MRVIKILAGVVVFFIIVLVFLFVKFVAIPGFTTETVTKQYTIYSINSTHEGPNDIVLKAKEDDRIMYINRGLEKYSLDFFQSHLQGKPANFTVQYFKRGVGRIIRIESGGIEIYKYGA